MPPRDDDRLPIKLKHLGTQIFFLVGGTSSSPLGPILDITFNHLQSDNKALGYLDSCGFQGIEYDHYKKLLLF
jgi:hypothetical protein